MRKVLTVLTAVACVLWPEAAVAAAFTVWVVRCCTE